jgi:hypothetical protein
VASGLLLAEHELLALATPTVAKEVYARRRTEKPLLVAVRLLSNLGVEDHYHHVASLLQVLPHGFSRQPLFFYLPAKVAHERKNNQHSR